MVAVTYVRDIDTSRAFYQLLGFHEQRSGQADTSAWLSLQQGGHFVLLASIRPPLAAPRLPLLFSFFFDDVDAVAGLEAAGVKVAHMGHPPHALGGEIKLTPTTTPSCSASESGRRLSRRPPTTRPLPISRC